MAQLAQVSSCNGKVTDLIPGLGCRHGQPPVLMLTIPCASTDSQSGCKWRQPTDASLFLKPMKKKMSAGEDKKRKGGGKKMKKEKEDFQSR